jgi:hypothetical protein
MNLIVLLFFRTTPLEIFTKIEYDDDGNQSVKTLEVPIPALYVMSSNNDSDLNSMAGYYLRKEPAIFLILISDFVS